MSKKNKIAEEIVTEQGPALVEFGEPVEKLPGRSSRIDRTVFEDIRDAATAHPGKFVPFNLPNVKSLQHYVGQINRGSVPELMPPLFAALTRRGQAYILFDPDTPESAESQAG